MPLIRCEKMTPPVYSEESRDFLLLVRLNDCVINGVKNDIDSIINLINTAKIKDNFIPLLQTKLGFYTSKAFDNEKLRQVLRMFPDAVKYKGSMKSIKQALNIFSRIAGITTKTHIGLALDGTVVNSINVPAHTVLLILESQVLNVDLLYELLKYLLPAGYGALLVFQYELPTAYVKEVAISYLKLIHVSDNINGLLRSFYPYDPDNKAIEWQPGLKYFWGDLVYHDGFKWIAIGSAELINIRNHRLEIDQVEQILIVNDPETGKYKLMFSPNPYMDQSGTALAIQLSSSDNPFFIDQEWVPEHWALVKWSDDPLYCINLFSHDYIGGIDTTPIFNPIAPDGYPDIRDKSKTGPITNIDNNFIGILDINELYDDSGQLKVIPPEQSIALIGDKLALIANESVDFDYHIFEDNNWHKITFKGLLLEDEYKESILTDYSDYDMIGVYGNFLSHGKIFIDGEWQVIDKYLGEYNFNQKPDISNFNCVYYQLDDNPSTGEIKGYYYNDNGAWIYANFLGSFRSTNEILDNITDNYSLADIKCISYLLFKNNKWQEKTLVLYLLRHLNINIEEGWHE